MTRLCVVKAGSTFARARDRFGDYDAMFLAPLRDLCVDALVVEAHAGAPLPETDAFDAVILSGSPASVTEPEAWTEAVIEWTQEVVAAEKPFLGVCYGHQLLGVAFGGRVERNPKGYEIGCVPVVPTEAGRKDPLLGAVLSPAPAFSSVHEDVVVELPPKSVHLASGGVTDVQAFRVGEVAWGVQFHPEFSEEIMALYLDERRLLLREAAKFRGEDPDVAEQRIRQGLCPQAHGVGLLRRFVKLSQNR